MGKPSTCHPDRDHVARGLCGPCYWKHREQWRTRETYRERVARTKAVAETRTCPVCLQPFPYIGKNGGATYCSYVCMGRARQIGKSCSVPYATCDCGALFVAGGRRRTHCRPSYYVPRPARTITCIVCGTEVTRQGRGRPRLTCSRGCLSRTPSSRAARKRAKARRRGATVVGAYDRLAIFQRDRWRCQLCGTPVPRTAKVPDHMAPTIDHIVPLAHGGSDTWANVRLAHFICNSRRGAGGVPRLASSAA